MISLNYLHKKAWTGVENDEEISMLSGYTDSEGRHWPSFESYRNAIEQIKPLQQTAWSKIYLNKETK